MTDEEIEKKAEEYATEDLPDGYTKINYVKKQAFQDGAKWGMEHQSHDLSRCLGKLETIKQLVINYDMCRYDKDNFINKVMDIIIKE